MLFGINFSRLSLTSIILRQLCADFALSAGLHIAFDLNACWGRSGPDAELNFDMISGMFNLAGGHYDCHYAPISI
jgi:hypothetical protein